MVKSRSVDLDGKSWGDANTECIAQGASLASIHTDAAQDRLFNAIQAGALDVWIGLQANSNIYYFVKINIQRSSIKASSQNYNFHLIFVDHHQWNWIDYTAYDYHNWNDGEPNSNDDSRYCGKIYRSNGFWDDTWCHEYATINGYICQKTRSKFHFLE